MRIIKPLTPVFFIKMITSLVMLLVCVFRETKNYYNMSSLQFNCYFRHVNYYFFLAFNAFKRKIVK